MDKKMIAIVALSISAFVLVVLSFLIPAQRVTAAESVKDRDYQMATARNQAGGESLYVTDNRTGRCAVFVWDATSRSLQVRAVGSLAEAFPAR